MGARMRRRFLRELFTGLRVVWPILSALLLVITALGLIIGLVEGWTIRESIYFAFVTGLTIGYGDFAPKIFPSRALAILIGACGMLMTALVAAITVRALAATTDDNGKRREGE
jgi:Ion channel